MRSNAPGARTASHAFRCTHGASRRHGRRADDVSHPPTATRSLHVTFLHDRPPKKLLDSLKAPKNIADAFALGKYEVFLMCPNGYGRTRLNNTFFEKQLQVRCTTRNWKTVIALHRLASARG